MPRTRVRCHSSRFMGGNQRSLHPGRLPRILGGHTTMGDLRKALLTFDAVLFDLDGVLTSTAKIHAACWKSMFDDFLRKYADRNRQSFVPFDIESDYRPYVDGKPRYEGVRSFLEFAEYQAAVWQPRRRSDHRERLRSRQSQGRASQAGDRRRRGGSLFRVGRPRSQTARKKAADGGRLVEQQLQGGP